MLNANIYDVLRFGDRGTNKTTLGIGLGSPSQLAVRKGTESGLVLGDDAQNDYAQQLV